MNRALITGITGHVGQELARQLLAAEVEVHGVTRGNREVDRVEPDKIQLHLLDGRTESVISIFETVRPDIVFHLAALARREHLTSDVIPFVNANILFGTQLLEACKAVGCRRFVVTGSYLQYDENGGYRPFNLYASTKQAFEDILALYVDAYGLGAAILTLCNVYSEHDPRATLLTDIADASASGRPLCLHAEEAWIDVVHVGDAAAAFIRMKTLLENSETREGALARYSVSSGREISSSELVALFEKLGERTITVKRGERRHPARRVKPWCGPTVPGWMPQVKIEEGMERLLMRSRERDEQARTRKLATLEHA